MCSLMRIVFEQETNPNSIMWPTWWTITSDSLSDDEDGTIYVTDEVCMLRCTVTMVLFEDGSSDRCLWYGFWKDHLGERG